MAALAGYFRSIGVKELVPGFYDDPAFMAVEQRDPTLLEKYAEFIDQQEYPQDYLDRARATVKSAATYLRERLVNDGRKGACLDAAGTLGRFLEREGIWNYVVKGALTITFDSTTKLQPVYFAPITNTPGLAAAHAWLVVPPLKVIDITTHRQNYPSRQHEDEVPHYVLADDVTPAASVPDDWIDPPVHAAIRSMLGGRKPTMMDIAHLVGPGAIACSTKFGTFQLRVGKARLKYTSIGITAGDMPLETAGNLVLCGLRPIELYRDFKSKQAG